MADKELATVRKKFVNMASKELVSQLLDDILEDGILNDGEKDSVLEENLSRADKARLLLDTVKRKGAKASKKMIDHIEHRDPTLYSELAAEPQMNQKWSTMLIPTTDAFWTEKQGDIHIYRVTDMSIRNRVALLITNMRFANQNLNRDGAEKDEQNMEKLLTDLGYEVVKYTNLTGKGIDDAITRFSKHPKLKETDSVLVVIMSHGKLGAVLGVNYTEDNPDEFSINNIYEHLGSEKCPALLNKPKIIIIQACRGEAGGAVLVSDNIKPAVVCDDVSAGHNNIVDDALHCVHKEKDFISLLSSTPDTVSYRQTDRGSLLIQYIVEVFYTCAHNDDVEELFRKVMQRFEDFNINPSLKQMPTKDRCTLTKCFYLCPGHSDKIECWLIQTLLRCLYIRLTLLYDELVGE